MNPRNVMHVTLDVLREAAASRYLIVLFGLIFLGLLALAFALDLEVVNGAIAAGKVFGSSLFSGTDKPVGAAEFLAPLMQGVVFLTFFGGLLLLIVAVADIAPRMLAPGRVEFLLSLPLRRTELVLGIYCGVVLIGALAALLAIGGASLVLFVKVELVTAAPFMGAVTALVGFASIYGVMLVMATVARSAALSAGGAVLVYVAGAATSDRQMVLSLIRDGTARELAAVLLGPLPRLTALAEIGGDVVMHKALAWSQAATVIGGCVAFGLFCVMGACIVVNLRDY